jgi:hypothetical protein
MSQGRASGFLVDSQLGGEGLANCYGASRLRVTGPPVSGLGSTRRLRISRVACAVMSGDAWATGNERLPAAAAPMVFAT